MTLQLNSPILLSNDHQISDFECGEKVLDDWLKRKAIANQQSGASRTFVVVDEQNIVRGYYALAAGAVAHKEVGSNIKRNMPDPIPVMVLARLAVDIHAQGLKLGASLLKDAVTRVYSVAENAGVRAMVVHALNDRAKQFYQHYGFSESPINPMTLLLRINSGVK